ncbi:MAG TPA: OsmC family peroxiredoxin [Leeuwenhoekiella sp.]|nr:OsmC family peroxiredoxin [Leeuwenhoekiella sp.]
MRFRNASAHWKGTLKEGTGSLTTESGALNEARYEYKTRFKDDAGTNPEELIGAAHAGCYTMQLSGLMTEDDIKADSLDTKAHVTFEDGEITKIELDVTGKVSGIDEKKFKEYAEKAKEVCPVSKLLNADISLKVTFKS